MHTEISRKLVEREREIGETIFKNLQQALEKNNFNYSLNTGG